MRYLSRSTSLAIGAFEFAMNLLLFFTLYFLTKTLLSLTSANMRPTPIDWFLNDLITCDELVLSGLFSGFSISKPAILNSD